MFLTHWLCPNLCLACSRSRLVVPPPRNPHPGRSKLSLAPKKSMWLYRLLGYSNMFCHLFLINNKLSEIMCSCVIICCMLVLHNHYIVSFKVIGPIDAELPGCVLCPMLLFISVLVFFCLSSLTNRCHVCTMVPAADTRRRHPKSVNCHFMFKFDTSRVYVLHNNLGNKYNLMEVPIYVVHARHVKLRVPLGPQKLPPWYNWNTIVMA